MFIGPGYFIRVFSFDYLSIRVSLKLIFLSARFLSLIFILLVELILFVMSCAFLTGPHYVSMGLYKQTNKHFSE